VPVSTRTTGRDGINEQTSLADPPQPRRVEPSARQVRRHLLAAHSLCVVRRGAARARLRRRSQRLRGGGGGGGEMRA